MKKNAIQFEDGLENSISGKALRREKIIEYLGNPDNQWVGRQVLATEILGYKKAQSLWNLFSSAELDELEQEALELRRKRCATISAKVDQALLERALDGDVKAIKLYYQRYENWSERQTLDHQGDRPIIKIGTYVKSD